MVDQLADHRILQHHIAYGYLNIDYQTPDLLLLSQEHRADNKIITVFQPFSYVSFIFFYLTGNFLIHFTSPSLIDRIGEI